MPRPIEPRSPANETKRERFGGAVVEEHILTPDDEGKVTEEWKETEFHPSKHEMFVEGQKENDDHILIARFERKEPGEKRPSLGLALRVDIWRETVNDRSPIVGVIVREVYATKGTKTDMRLGDIILVDENGEIAEKTQDGKEVPAIFRNEENKAKISILIAQKEQKITGVKRMAA